MPDRAIFSLSSCLAAAERGRRSISLHSVRTDPASPGSRGKSARADGPVAPRAIPRSAIRRARSRMTGFKFRRGNGRVDTDRDGATTQPITGQTAIDGHGNSHDATTTQYDDGSMSYKIPSVHADGTVDRYISFYANGVEGTGKHVHTRNGVPVNDVHLVDPIKIPVAVPLATTRARTRTTKRDRGTQRTASPAPKARDVRAAVRAMWIAVGGDASMAASRPPRGQTRGMPITAARSLVGGSIGPGAVTDPTPMDDTTGSSGGGYHDPAPGANPGDPDAPGTP